MGGKPSFVSLNDAMKLAKQRLPNLVYDFIEGAAGLEIAAAGNCEAFSMIKLQPRILQDVNNRQLGKAFLGHTYALPFGIAPMGMCNLVHPRADQLIAKLAREQNIPVCLSTAGSTTIEEFGAIAGNNGWFQLYVQSQDQAMAMVERAEKAKYETLVLTLDVPHVSRRVRDIRNGFQIPFRIGARQFADFARHPTWSISRLLNGIPKPVNFDLASDGKGFDRNAPRTGANLDFLRKLRTRWKGNLVIKGVMSPKDALVVQNEGVDAIWVSNHGGRQLDASPAAISALPQIRAAAGEDFPLLFDSGIRSGEDVVKALALGADFVMLGRSVLYALGAGGGVGLNCLINNFQEDVSTVLAQTGLKQVEDISPKILADPSCSKK